MTATLLTFYSLLCTTYVVAISIYPCVQQIHFYIDYQGCWDLNELQVTRPRRVLKCQPSPANMILFLSYSLSFVSPEFLHLYFCISFF